MLNSFLTLIISATLILLYWKRILRIESAILISLSLSTYHLSIGNTLNPFFFLSIVILLESFQTGIDRARIRLGFLLLFLAPFISSFFVWFILFIGYNPFEIKAGEYLGIFTHPFYYYFKTYLPLIAIGYLVQKRYTPLSINNYFRTLTILAVLFSLWSYLQLFVFSFIDNPALNVLLGIQDQYQYYLGGIRLVRVSGLCSEPKDLSILLGISLPVLLNGRKYIQATIVASAGLLTISHTFIIIIFCAFIVHIINKLTASVRLKVLGSLGIIIGLFLFVNSMAVMITKLETSVNSQIVNKLLIERIVARYKYDNPMSGKSILGMPIQADLEAPVIDFFSDHNILFVTGYGPGNAIYVPDKYFWGTWAYQSRRENMHRGHVNMGWLFYVLEMGVIVTVILFLKITYVSHGMALREKFFSFLLVTLFFTRVEPFLVPIYAIIKKQESITKKWS